MKATQTQSGSQVGPDSTTWTQARPFDVSNESVRQVGVTTDGQLRALAGYAISVWNTATGTKIRTIELPADGTPVAIDASWKYVLANHQSAVSVFDVGAQRQLWKNDVGITPVPGDPSSHFGYSPAAFGPDGTQFAIRLNASEIGVFGASNGRKLRALTSNPPKPTAYSTHLAGSVSFSLDGRIVAAGMDDGTIDLWESASGRYLGRLERHAGAVAHVSFSADNMLVASIGRDRVLKVWTVDTRRELHAFAFGHETWADLATCAFSTDMQLLASGGEDGNVVLWNLEKGEPVGRLTPMSQRYVLCLQGQACDRSDRPNYLQGEDGAWIRSIAFGQRDLAVVAGTDDGKVWLWRRR